MHNFLRLISSSRIISFIVPVIISALFVSTLVTVSLHTSYAATFEAPAGDVAALIDAINAANGNMEADTINLAQGGAYTLTTIDNETDGNNGLPSLTTEITINGNGATVQRAFGDVAEFRILHVSETGNVTINDLIVLNGRSSGGEGTEINGGGIYSRGLLEINFCAFVGNSAVDFGGGVANFGGDMTINSSGISGNSADRDGGGLDTDGGTVTINDSDISDNDADETSGGISNFFATMTINRCSITGNTVNGDGAGVWNNDTLTINSSDIFDNSAGSDGGGIFNHASAMALSINHTAIEGNTAGADGGGIFNDAPAMAMGILYSSLAGNIAGADGGGIFNDGGIIEINSITISGNSAVGNGGGISNDAGSVRINSSTITDNSAVDGGGLLNAGFAELINTIVANQLSGADCFNVAIIGILGSLGHNIDSDGTCLAFAVDGDMPSTDPLLGPLQNNGGTTLTHALLQGSPAIDMGDPAGCFDTDGALFPTDQRGPGFPRTVDGDGNGSAICDIGTFEAPVLAIVEGSGGGSCAIAPVNTPKDAPIQMPASMILLVLIGLRLTIWRRLQKVYNFKS